MCDCPVWAVVGMRGVAACKLEMEGAACGLEMEGMTVVMEGMVRVFRKLLVTGVERSLSGRAFSGKDV